MSKIRGIDVSRWQGVIDWKKVKADGIEFAIIKAGGADDGLYTDRYFEDNYKNAKAEGLHVGCYYFTSKAFCTASQGKTEAEHFLKIIKGKTFDYPVYADIEAVPTSAGADKITDAAIAFCDTVEDAGYYVGIYSSDVAGFSSRLVWDRLKAYDKWIARWTSNEDAMVHKEYGLWQYSSTGRVSGISGDVDLDYGGYKDYPTIMKNNGLNGFKKETVTTTESGSKENTVSESELRRKVADWLKKYLGIKEGSAGHKEILAVYNNSKLCTRYTMGVSDAWCATAVSAAFIGCGLAGKQGSGSLFECVECSCWKMTQYAQQQGIWVENDAYVPKVGDVIMYDWDDNGVGDCTGGADHVGIVAEVGSSSFKVIEGNASDTVLYRTVAINGKNIRGFITPNYAKFAGKAQEEPKQEEPKQEEPKIKAGYSVGDIVNFVGTTHYSSSNSTSPKSCKGGTAKVTQKYNGKHPYHLIAEKGGGGTVYGWVDANDIKPIKAEQSTSGEKKEEEKPVVKPTATSVRATSYATHFDIDVSGIYKTTASLHCRDGAGTNYKSLVVIPAGTIVRNYGYYNVVGGVKWLYIQFVLNGVTYTGFSSSKYLKK